MFNPNEATIVTSAAFIAKQALPLSGQWAGMGAGLMQRDPSSHSGCFRASVDHAGDAQQVMPPGEAGV